MKLVVQNLRLNCTSHFMNRFQVNFRGWGGSYSVGISSLHNLNNGDVRNYKINTEC
jgi:hypothetical protein